VSQAFAEHIRFCANKLQLGVNFLPNTPNYDRVVEMQVCRAQLGGVVCLHIAQVCLKSQDWVLKSCKDPTCFS
jgi:hypothetical protein